MLSMIFIILLLMQGFGGTISNALSLSYFLKKDRETLASKLMILLNSIDLLVCFSALASFFYAVLGENVMAYQLGLWFHFLLAATAFVTCLLSVTRTISLVYPFYEIKKKAIVLATAIYGLTLIFSRLMRPSLQDLYSNDLLIKAANIYHISEMTLIIFIVIISLISSVVKLQSGDNNLANSDPARRHATITIIIISGFFCAVNIAYLICVVVISFGGTAIWKDKTALSIAVSYSTYVGIPLNSTINPIIYFIRKKQIRDYVKSTCIGGCCYRCCCCCCRVRCGRRENEIENLERANTNTETLGYNL